MRFETRLDVTVDEYMTMIAGKSAALIGAATYLGAWVAGAAEAVAGKYLCFGHHLGLAFQIKDDILGIWGDAGITGKSTSDDIQNRKKTLPVVYALERSPALRRLYAAGNIPPEQVSWVVDELVRVGAREMAESASAEHHQKAMGALEQSGARGPAAAALAEMAVKLLTRLS
jgi:geranylgeranyl diphosphate synthase type I